MTLQLCRFGSGGAGVELADVRFQALDIEQDWACVAGLLDHTAVRSSSVGLGLKGKRYAGTGIELANAKGYGYSERKGCLKLLKRRSAGRSGPAIKRIWRLSRMQNRYRRAILQQLWRSVLTIAKLYERSVAVYWGCCGWIRVGYPVRALRAGMVYVAGGTDRRSAGDALPPPGLRRRDCQVYVGAVGVCGSGGGEAVGGCRNQLEISCSYRCSGVAMGWGVLVQGVSVFGRQVGRRGGGRGTQTEDGRRKMERVTQFGIDL
jgi:hypothetical protein